MSATLALILAAAPIASAPASGAGRFADLAAIDREVSSFTGLPAGADGGAAMPVDRRLRLVSCGSPLVLSWRTARRETVVVECPDAGGWRLFVPVRRDLPVAGIAETPLVNRGDAVTIAVAGDGFAVSQPGEAMDAGGEGAWIRVRTNNPKAQPMRARVVRPGLVEVPMP